jgi:Zn finger protein HypA/HybF involved in hydrogenase expression
MDKFARGTHVTFSSVRESAQVRRKEMAEKGYCVKCKASKEMKDEQKVTMKNGRAAVKGKCPDCGTGMYKILGKK